MEFRTRREQIEKDFLPHCMKNPTRAVIKEELKGAAMVGACEERDRTLRIIDSLTDEHLKRLLSDQITAVGVLQVIGYE